MHWVSLGLAFVALLWLTRRQWFFLDEWAMFTHFDASGNSVGALTPWNEHWTTAVFLYYQAMYHVVGLHSYTPYLVVLIGLHLGIVHGLWRLMVSLGADRWIAVAAALLFAFYGAGWENLIWAFQIGYLAPLLLGLLALQWTCLGTPSRTRDALSIAALTVGLTFSDIGLVTLFCCAVAVALHRGVKTAAGMHSLPVAVYAAWYLVVGRSTVKVTGSVTAIPLDVLRGLVGSLGGIFGSVVFGGALLVGLIWFVMRRRAELRGRLAVPTAMAVSAVLFGTLTALGRGNMETSLVPRYFYVDLFFLLPMISLAATWVIRRQALRRVALLGAFAAGAGFGWVTLVHVSDDYALLNTETHQYVVAAATLVADPDAHIRLSPSASIENHFFPFIHLSTIERFNRDGVLSHDIQPSASIERTVAVRLERP